MTINEQEYKSSVGLSDLYYALVTEDDSAGYAADTPVYLAPAMDASLAPASNAKVQYADNSAFDAMMAEGETKVTTTITGMAVETLAVVTGKVFDPTTGRLYDNGGVPPYVAIGFKGKRSNGKSRYYWFLKGRFTTPPEDKASQSDTPDPKPIKLEFSALKTVHQFNLGALTDGVKRVMGDEDTDNFSATGWFDTVQTPATAGVSAVSVTSDPLNSAINVAITKTITLTFNNAMREDSADGVSVVRVDNSTPATIVKSWDVTGKILTITHTASFANNKQYFITIAGLTDIYGQVLATAIEAFTTIA
jgi:phi13 family phage major tail protein